MSKAEDILKPFRLFPDDEGEQIVCYEDALRCMEEYAENVIEERMPTEEEIEKQFSDSLYNTIHPARYRKEGALWFRNRMKGDNK